MNTLCGKTADLLPLNMVVRILTTGPWRDNPKNSVTSFQISGKSQCQEHVLTKLTHEMDQRYS
jgi:hypothetical protein